MTREQKVYLRLILYYFGLLTVGSFVLSILYSIILMILKGPNITQQEMLSQMANLSSILELFILFLVIFLARKKANLRFRKISFSLRDIYWILGGLATIFIGEIALGNLSEFFHLDITSQNEKDVRQLLAVHPSIMIITAVLVAPILEEFIFRKSMIGHLFKNHSYVGLIFSSLLFGLAHMMDGFGLMAYIQYTLMGGVLGFVYLKSQKSEVNTALHILNNAVAVFLPFL